ncbi:hypothetical protein [Paenibacillus tengchongensis]|uniref:hypothetical protein n=1 Tax=Paenibacillus tengchongensis TaxID=2608684 RepID=UPI00124D3081|nr:hypothetical protein [Paenibacillus tengchongensis]
MTIAVQPYYKVERIMTGEKLEIIKQRRLLCLCPTQIHSAYHRFFIEDVFDVSFKDYGQGHAVLYLHTKQGVYPYTIEAVDEMFVAEVKRLIAQLEP